MFPELYQKVIEIHLTESQRITLQLLIMLLQSYRNVRLSQLAELFPQPIKYESRVRNLQRFLNLPQLSVKLLWFPILKKWIRTEYRQRTANRKQRRRAKKLKLIHQGYLLLVIDRTQYPMVVLGDREFHSVKLAKWLEKKGVDFALRQKRSRDAEFSSAYPIDQDRKILVSRMMNKSI